MAQPEGEPIPHHPYRAYPLSEDEMATVSKLYEEKFILVGPKHWYTRDTFMKYGSWFHHFDVRPSDVWLVGFPRSGTTVAQEMIWLVCNEANVQKANKTILRERFPTFEHLLFYSPSEIPAKNVEFERIMRSWDHLQETTERRFIKSHLPFDLMPANILDTKAKVVAILRDPKEVVVSNYRIYKQFSVLSPFPDFPVFWRCFKNNLVLWGPYFEHVKEIWAKRHEENVLVIFYDDIVERRQECIRKIAKFFEVKLSQDQVKVIDDHIRTTNFRKSLTVQASTDSSSSCEEGSTNFVSSSSNWKQFFTDGLEDEVEDWIAENMRDTDLKFTDNA